MSDDADVVDDVDDVRLRGGPNVRKNGPAYPLAVAMAVRERLGIKPWPDVEPSPADALPIDPIADLEETRRILKNLRLTASRSTRSATRPARCSGPSGCT